MGNNIYYTKIYAWSKLLCVAALGGTITVCCFCAVSKDRNKMRPSQEVDSKFLCSENLSGIVGSSDPILLTDMTYKNGTVKYHTFSIANSFFPKSELALSGCEYVAIDSDNTIAGYTKVAISAVSQAGEAGRMNAIPDTEVSVYKKLRDGRYRLVGSGVVSSIFIRDPVLRRQSMHETPLQGW